MVRWYKTLMASLSIVSPSERALNLGETMDVVEETHAQWKALRDGTVENGAFSKRLRVYVFVRACAWGGEVFRPGMLASGIHICETCVHILIIFITTLDVVWPSYERHMRLDR